MTALAPSAQAEYIKQQGECTNKLLDNQPILAMAQAIKQLSGDVSDVQGVANKAFTAVAHVESEQTRKTQAVVNPLAVSFAVHSREATAQKNSNDWSKATAAAAEAGDVTVGNIGLSSSQHSGNESPVNRAGRESTTLVIGSKNDTSTGFDNSRQLTGTEASQQLDTSATGSVTKDAKTNGNIVADELEAAPVVEDNDGENGIF